jgi:hypothetical protein
MKYLQVGFAVLFVFSTLGVATAAPEDRTRALLLSVCKRVEKIADSETKRICREEFQSPANPKALLASGPGKSPGKTAVKDPPSADDTPQRIFVRANPIDNFWYGLLPGGVGGLQGASVSYTNDHVAKTQKAVVNGEISYLWVPPNYSDLDVWGDYALASWFAANGNWSEPLKKPENSAFKIGLDGQVRFRSADLLTTDVNRKWNFFFSVSPYLQTDFRQVERAGGITVAFEPVIPELLLGAGKANEYFLAFWILRPEADFRQVANPGFTSQRKGNYEWLGYTTRGNLQFLPLPTGNRWVDEWLVNRFVLIATAQYFWDAHSSSEARYYTAQLQYNLGPCNFPKTSEPGVYSDCAITGNSAISFEYDWGTDKDTLVFTNQYLLKLSYKY